jgi:hypothetical protein
MLHEAARYKSVLRVEAQLHAQAAVLQGKQPTSIGQEERVVSLPAFILGVGGGVLSTSTENQIPTRPACSPFTMLNELSRLQIKVFLCQT